MLVHVSMVTHLPQLVVEVRSVGSYSLLCFEARSLLCMCAVYISWVACEYLEILLSPPGI